MAKKKGLTAKQERFAEEYLVDMNATQAAIRAGYSKKTAYSQGERLLRNVEIQGLIAEGRKQLSVNTRINAEDVLLEYARLAFSNMDRYIRVTPDGLAEVDLSELNEDQAAAIQQFEVTTEMVGDENPIECKKVKFRLHDKKHSLDKLASHLGIKGMTQGDVAEAIGSLRELINASEASE